MKNGSELVRFSINSLLFSGETIPTVVDHHELKWNADLPDQPDKNDHGNQVNQRPIFGGAKITNYSKLTTKEREIWGLLRQLTAPDGKSRASARQIMLNMPEADRKTAVHVINPDSATRVKQFLAAAKWKS